MKDFSVPTPKASRHSNLNFSSHVSQSEQEMEYNHMILDAGLYFCYYLKDKLALY